MPGLLFISSILALRTFIIYHYTITLYKKNSFNTLHRSFLGGRPSTQFYTTSLLDSALSRYLNLGLDPLEVDYTFYYETHLLFRDSIAE